MNGLFVKAGTFHSTNKFNKYFVLYTPYSGLRAVLRVNVQWDTTVNH